MGVTTTPHFAGCTVNYSTLAGQAAEEVADAAIEALRTRPGTLMANAPERCGDAGPGVWRRRVQENRETMPLRLYCFTPQLDGANSLSRSPAIRLWYMTRGSVMSHGIPR